MEIQVDILEEKNAETILLPAGLRPGNRREKSGESANRLKKETNVAKKREITEKLAKN